MKKPNGWIGFDLDSTLAESDASPNYDHCHIGNPIQPTIDLLKKFLNNGWHVKIFTARVSSSEKPYKRFEASKAIEEWCQKHIGVVLDITSEKDWECKAIFDDRAYHVHKNTGQLTDELFINSKYFS